MNTVTQKMKFRQSLVNYSDKYGVTKAAIKYNVNRQYIYRWKKRYDGTLQSLADKSHKPNHHPNEHTEEEIKLIKDMRRRNPHDGLVVFWVKLRSRGYTRSITGLYRKLRKLGESRQTPKNPKYIPKPYEKMLFPGQRVQIDVKVVPTACIVGDAQGEMPKAKSFINTLLLMSIPDLGTLKRLENKAHILQRFFLSICSRHFPLKYTVFKPTTALNLPKSLEAAKRMMI